MEESEALEDAAWWSGFGVGASHQAALLEADPMGCGVSLGRLVAGVDRRLDEGRSDRNAPREAALTALRTQLQGALDGLSGPPTAATATATASDTAHGASTGEAEPAGEAQLQATWDAGRLVVWSAGRGIAPADGDQLSDCLESVDAPPHGWAPHRSVPLPDGT